MRGRLRSGRAVLIAVCLPHPSTPLDSSQTDGRPTAPRLRVTSTVKRADNGRCMLACGPVASESRPVIPGRDPAERGAVAASDPSETAAVRRGSERDLTLIAGVLAFELRDGVTEAHASHLAQPMTALLSHLRYTPRSTPRRSRLMGDVLRREP
jgi:hypothetical protein